LYKYLLLNLMSSGVTSYFGKVVVIEVLKKDLNICDSVLIEVL